VDEGLAHRVIIDGIAQGIPGDIQVAVEEDLELTRALRLVVGYHPPQVNGAAYINCLADVNLELEVGI
jgi:hypothetical protein